MILQDRVTRGLSNFMERPVKVTHNSAKLGSHKHCGTGNLLKEFISLTMVAMEMGKKTLFQLS